MYKQFWIDQLDGSQIKYSGNHLIGTCPICEDKKHFYINIKTGLWDCKKCQAHGNVWSYLEKYRNMGKNEIVDCLDKYKIETGYLKKTCIQKHKKTTEKKEPAKIINNKITVVENNCKRITDEQIKRFSEERGLSVDILKKHQLGMDELGKLTLPFYDEKGRLRNIQHREFGPGAKIISEKDSQTVLFGVEDLIGDNCEDGDIFIVEGPWSALALKDKGYKAVGTWSAGDLKEDQAKLFKGKEVFIIPDNDDPGYTGAETIKEKLENIARHIHIIEIPVEEKQDIRDFFKNGGSEDHFNYLVKQAILERLNSYPITLENFLKKDIPNVEYYVESILQKNGKGMISASPTIGKSVFVQNIVLDIARGADKFINKFSVTSARVLYLDLEMGESALKERFSKMVENRDIEINNLFIKYVPALDLTQKENRKMIEEWIDELKVKVLVLDPLGNAWSGNENDQEQVGNLISYLNTISEIYGLSILVIHHWRKATKEFKSGSQMAAGSYRWSAWLDSHITLAEKSGDILVSCEKLRNKRRFEPFLVKIKDDFSLEFLADCGNKPDFNNDTLELIFSSFNTERVSVPDMIKFTETMKGGPSEATVRRLLKTTRKFHVDEKHRPHMVSRVPEQITKWGEEDEENTSDTNNI